MLRPDDRNTNIGSPSTTWGWRRVKIGRPPEAQGTARLRSSSAALRPGRDPRTPLTVQVTYRGGPECWWELRSRGLILRRSGATAIHDALMELQGVNPGAPPAEGARRGTL